MNLGETIYKLRTEENMSQGDLANALDVSRQSISKWETNSSVPELDKLIKLSEVFGVSLDELILNKHTQEALPPQSLPTEAPAPSSSQKAAGIILLCFGALVWILITLLGDFLSGLVFALPFLSCGLICLFVHKNAGLWCGWATFISVDLYLRLATGANWMLVFRAFQYSIGLSAHVLIAWLQLICLISLGCVTVLRFRKTPQMSVKKNAMLASIAWALWILLHVTLQFTAIDPAAYIASSLLLHVVSELKTILFIAGVSFSVRVILSFIKSKK